MGYGAIFDSLLYSSYAFTSTCYLYVQYAIQVNNGVNQEELILLLQWVPSSPYKKQYKKKMTSLYLRFWKVKVAVMMMNILYLHQCLDYLE